MLTEERQEKITTMLQRRQRDLTVVLEDVHDPHNVSAVLRSCDAVGVATVHLVYPVGRFPKISNTTSSSAGKWIEVVRHDSIEACYHHLAQQGMRIYATYLGEDTPSRMLYDLDLTGKVALVFGNEHAGVSEYAWRHADANFQIPMMGMVQSLNISVAAAVTLYEALRQRQSGGAYDTPQFSEEDIAAYLDTVAWAPIRRRLRKQEQ